MIKGIDIAIPNRSVPTLQRGAFRGLAVAVIITGFLGGAVISDGGGISVSDNVALAKGGNGGGGGKGGGGGHGGGKKGDHGGVAGDGHAKGYGNGHAKDHGQIDGHDHSQGHGLGHSKGHGHAHAGRNGENDGHSDPPGAPSLGNGSASKKGISAAALGSLNAANASSTARQNASPNSMVGHIAAFADAVEAENNSMNSENIDAAAEALAAKANKPITEDVVKEVARKVDVEVSDETASAIAERAAAIQNEGSDEPTGQSMPSGS